MATAVYELAGPKAATIAAWILAIEPTNVFFSNHPQGAVDVPRRGPCSAAPRCGSGVNECGLAARLGLPDRHRHPTVRGLVLRGRGGGRLAACIASQARRRPVAGVSRVGILAFAIFVPIALSKSSDGTLKRSAVAGRQRKRRTHPSTRRPPCREGDLNLPKRIRESCSGRIPGRSRTRASSWAYWGPWCSSAG